MKIRTDFVTNSSSSSFVTVRFISEKGECAYSVDMDFEMPDENEALKLLSSMKTTDDIMSFFGVSEGSLLFTSNDFSAESASIEDITKIRYAEGCLMYGEEASAYLEDLGFDPYDFDPDSEEAKENVKFDLEGNILSGSAAVYDLKNKTVSTESLDEDDGYGA